MRSAIVDLIDELVAALAQEKFEAGKMNLEEMANAHDCTIRRLKEIRDLAERPPGPRVDCTERITVSASSPSNREEG